MLGNGFSIACDPIFQYESLYDRAVEAGLSERARAVFERLGQNNFEGAMRLLDHTDWVARTYGLIDTEESEMLEDVERLKEALVRAISDSHLAHAGEVPDEKKAAALRFLRSFHNVFTVNYDLLLYWVVMFEDPPHFQDGFRADPDDHEAPYLVFHERIGRNPGIHFIHGALHLHRVAGELRKHSWIRTGERLTDLVRTGLEANQYPVFVAEGTADKKFEQISEDAYLSYCLGKLGRIKNPLVIFGHALRETDRHILHTLAANRNLRIIYVGLFGDPGSAENMGTMASANYLIRKRRDFVTDSELEVKYFRSETASVWE